MSSEEREEESRLALVLKFLKKAARNLLQPMRCPVPTLNPSLALCARQELVGHLLHEFVAAYEHETELLRVRLRAHETSSTSTSGGGARARSARSAAALSVDAVPAHAELLAGASERQLEQLLSAFALRKDAAASALLGVFRCLVYTTVQHNTIIYNTVEVSLGGTCVLLLSNVSISIRAVIYVKAVQSME